MGSFQRFVRRMILFQKRSSLISDWKKYVLFDLLTPILQMLCYSLIAFYAYGNDHVQKWMIGNAILISAFGSLYGVGVQILVEKRTGTLSLLIASKTKLHEIFLASTISTVLNSFLSVIIGISVVSLIFRIAWSFDLIFALLQVLIIAVFVSMSFGFIFSCFILLTSEINLILNTVSRILLIFSGANFPIEDLPIFFRSFSLLLPLTRSISAAQGLMIGEPIGNYTSSLLLEFFLGVAYLLLGTLLLNYMERKSRDTGTVDFL